MIDIFDFAAVLRDKYAADYDHALKEREGRLRFRDNSIRPDSDEWMRITKEINEEFSANISATREATLKEADKYFADERAKLDAWVKSGFRSQSFRELTDLMDRVDRLNLTAEEVELIASTYSQTNNYWCLATIREFAEKHGTILNLPPDYATKKSVLDKLEANIVSFLNEYDGDPGVKVMGYLHDSTLVKMEAEFTNDFAQMSNVSLEKKVKRAVHNIYSQPGINEQFQVLRNTLTSCDDERLRDAIIDRLCTDNKLSEQVVRLSRFNKLAEEYTKKSYTVEGFIPEGTTPEEKKFYSELRKDFDALSDSDKEYVVNSSKVAGSNIPLRDVVDFVKNGRLKELKIKNDAEKRAAATQDETLKQIIKEEAEQAISALKEGTGNDE